MQQRNMLFAAFISLLMVSCGGGDGTPLSPVAAPTDCSISEQNRFVHELLKDRYLWYREVPVSIDYSNFDSPQQTLDFIKYHDKDRYSFITEAQAFDSLFNAGQYIGYGFSYLIDTMGRVKLKFVYHDSEAGRAGLQRGDEILTINGQTVAKINAAQSWDTVFGADKQGVPLDMLVRKKDGSTLTVQMKKSIVNINTVLSYSIIHQSAENIGYLMFNSFLSTSLSELEPVFAEFKAQGVSRVILDLRYNGGGSVFVAEELASYLYDNQNSQQLFGLLQQNDKHRELNSRYFFHSKANELHLQQLVVITTGATASASEMIINGLKPYIEVKTVGSTSYGKPVGMNGREFCGKIILPITFQIYNVRHQSGYFNGIPADCNVADDVSYTLGDQREPMLAEALRMTRGMACSRTSARPATRPPVASHAPPLRDMIGAI